MSPAQLIVASLVLPLAGAAAIALAGRWPNLRESATLATAVALFACVLGLLPGVLRGAVPQLFVLEMLPGIALGFRVEPLGMVFALVASGLPTSLLGPPTSAIWVLVVWGGTLFPMY